MHHEWRKFNKLKLGCDLIHRSRLIRSVRPSVRRYRHTDTPTNRLMLSSGIPTQTSTAVAYQATEGCPGRNQPQTVHTKLPAATADFPRGKEVWIQILTMRSRAQPWSSLAHPAIHPSMSHPGGQRDTLWVIHSLIHCPGMISTAFVVKNSGHVSTTPLRAILAIQ